MMSFTRKSEYLPSLTSAQPCHLFSLAEIQLATNDFDDKLIIGQGGFGKVYKGSICIKETSQLVAIKRLDSMSNQGATEFKAEIKMLSTLRHCNLVSLIGYCDDNMEMILVYVYMPRGTLYDHLHKFTATPLSWIQRLKIAIGAGRGLDYLHTGVGTQHGVIHRDVKSSNILLDENWAAMISDFGLSKIGPIDQTAYNVSVSVKGTFGYLDPEYIYTRKLTRKTDVYAFGVLLFELLSGMLAVDERLEEEQRSLAWWAQKCVKEKKMDQMVDSNITGTIAPKCLRGFAEIAYRCLLRDIEKRPSMTRVVAKLQDLLELQEKCDNSADSSGTAGFTWKIHNYIAFATRQNSDQGDTSSTKSAENNMNYWSPVNRDGGDLVRMFKYRELESATGNFKYNNFYGWYGQVSKGWVDNTTFTPCKAHTGLPIAVKKVHYKYNIDLEMFKAYRHPNLVKLIGYCLEAGQLFLVYEFMHNGNLEDLLSSRAIEELPLVTKVKIVVGIARAIIIWNETQPEVAEGLQTGTISESKIDRRKILLDKDFKPKISSYHLTKLICDYYRKIRYEELDGCDVSCCDNFLLQINLDAFIVVFAEVITGKQLSDEKNIKKINGMLRKSGKNSLCSIAKLCFEKCNEVDSELTMLKILEKCEIPIPT